jgi:hypothetical protein
MLRISRSTIDVQRLRCGCAVSDFPEHLVARCTAHEFIIYTALDQIIDTLNDPPEVLLFGDRPR